jgi:UDP-glucose 4-epimerase
MNKTKVVWIFGINSFIGRNLSNKFILNNFNVIGFGQSKENYSNNPYYNYDSQDIFQAFEKYGRPNLIYYLTGPSSIPSCYENFRHDFYKSTLTYIDLLEFLKNNKISTRIFVSSSSSIYKSSKKRLSENSEKLINSPYTLIKLTLEDISIYYTDNYDLNIVILRIFSVYGEGLNKLIFWDLCNKLKKSNLITIEGDGNQIRDWIYISDFINILYKIKFKKFKKIDFINIASGKAYNLKEILYIFVNSYNKIYKTNVDLKFSYKKTRGKNKIIIPNITKLNNLINIKFINHNKNIENYIKWFKKLYG